MEIIYLLIYGEKWEGYTVASAHATKKGALKEQKAFNKRHGFKYYDRSKKQWKKGPKGVDFSEIIIRAVGD